MFAVAFAIGLARILGGAITLATTPLTLLFVLATGIPAPASAVWTRLAGLGVGTVLAALGAVLLWPLPARSAVGRALERAAHALAAWLQALASGGPAEASRADADAAVSGLLPALAEAADRPIGLTAVDRGRAALVHNLGRVQELTARLADRGRGDPALLAEAGGALAEAAEVLAGRPGGPREARLEADLRERRDGLGGAVRGMATGPRGLLAACEQAFTADELAATVVAAGHARAAGGKGSIPLATATLRPGDSVVYDPTRASWTRAAQRRIATHLTFRSHHFRVSLRTALGLATAMAVTKGFDLHHGFWVVLATLVVMQTSARATSMSALEAVLGTCIGFALSLVLVLLADVDHWIYVVLLPPLFFASVLAAETVGLVAGQACFALLIVVLFNLLKPATWELGLVRVEDVLVGAAVGVLFGLLVWPRGAAAQLRFALAALLRSGADYAASVARDRLGGSPAGDAERRREAMAAALRAEDEFAACLAQRRPAPAQLATWVALLVAGDRLWYAADRAFSWPRADAPGCPALAAGLEESAARIERGYGALARAIAAGRDGRDGRARPAPSHPWGEAPPELDAAALVCAERAASDGADVVGLLWTRYWTGELLGALPAAAQA